MVSKLNKTIFVLYLCYFESWNEQLYERLNGLWSANSNWMKKYKRVLICETKYVNTVIIFK